MANKTFYMSLNKKSINECVKWLEEYKKSLTSKTEQFVNELADIGIKVAYDQVGASGRYGTHKMEDRITFTKEVDAEKYGCKAIVIGQGEIFTSVWDNGLKSADVYPLQMVEYGTNHNGSMDWTFIDENGKPFLNATGIMATQPMYSAYREMKLQIIDVAKRVYGS